MNEQEKMDAMRNALKKAGASASATSAAKNSIADAMAKKNVAKKPVPLGKAKPAKGMPGAKMKPVTPADVEYKIKRSY